LRQSRGGGKYSRLKGASGPGCLGRIGRAIFSLECKMANREQRKNKEKKKPKADKNKAPATPATPFGNAPNRNQPKPAGKK
jgi:hypothetical protein